MLICLGLPVRVEESVIEQRKSRRFDLRLPFELIRIRSVRVQVVSETKNISSIGVLFLAESGLDVGDPIEYIVTLPTGRDGNTVKIRCLGKVVRVVNNEDMVSKVPTWPFHHVAGLRRLLPDGRVQGDLAGFRTMWRGATLTIASRNARRTIAESNKGRCLAGIGADGRPGTLLLSVAARRGRRPH